MEKVITFLELEHNHIENHGQTDHYKCDDQMPCPCTLDMSTALGYEREMKQHEKLYEVCKPVLEYLKNECDEYTEIHISSGGIKQVNVITGIPLENGDYPKNNRQID